VFIVSVIIWRNYWYVP